MNGWATKKSPKESKIFKNPPTLHLRSTNRIYINLNKGYKYITNLHIKRTMKHESIKGVRIHIFKIHYSTSFFVENKRNEI